MNNIKEISKIIAGLKDDKKVYQILNELLTESEIDVLSKRWHILKLLADGATQREIAKELGVSLCKVTRGAKLLKENSIVKKHLKGDKNDKTNNK